MNCSLFSIFIVILISLPLSVNAESKKNIDEVYLESDVDWIKKNLFSKRDKLVNAICNGIKNKTIPCYSDNQCTTVLDYLNDSLKFHTINLKAHFNQTHLSSGQQTINVSAFSIAIKEGKKGEWIGIYISNSDLMASMESIELDFVLSMCLSFYGTSSSINKWTWQYANNNAIRANLGNHAYALLSNSNLKALAYELAKDISFYPLETIDFFTDKKLLNPIDFKNNLQKEIIQVEDRRYKGEFKDSVVFNAYNLSNAKFLIQRDIVQINCSTGETIYCLRSDFYAEISPTSQAFLETLFKD